MIVFATEVPASSFYLTPILPAFSEPVVHLIPQHSEMDDGTVPQTQDLGILTGASAVVITGGQLTDWTADIAIQAKTLGVSVFYLEVSEIGGQRTIPNDLGDLVDHAFCGSAISKLTICSDMGMPEQRVSTIGYPILDDVIVAGQPSDAKFSSFLISGGERATDQQRRELIAVAGTLKSLGYGVSVLVHPHDDPARWEIGVPLVTDGFAASVAGHDGLISVPGLINLVAYAAGTPTWHIATHAVEENKVYSQLSSPIASIMNPEDSIFAPDLRNADIAEHIVGPLDGKASERLRILILLSEIS